MYAGVMVFLLNITYATLLIPEILDRPKLRSNIFVKLGTSNNPST